MCIRDRRGGEEGRKKGDKETERGKGEYGGRSKRESQRKRGQEQRKRERGTVMR